MTSKTQRIMLCKELVKQLTRYFRLRMRGQWAEEHLKKQLGPKNDQSDVCKAVHLDFTISFILDLYWCCITVFQPDAGCCMCMYFC